MAADQGKGLRYTVQIWTGKLNPGKVFDLTLPLEQAAEG